MAGEIASFRALSREGHAAMSMRGETDRWILIQKNTFTNWVNEQLRVVGSPMIEDLQTDFCDGIRLCALIESLQEKKINRVIKKPINQHQELENVTKALNAVANDNIRLVNIGSEDIVNGNLKLILGLIWHLILRYQIGKTKFPAKKLMLAWLRAVIPECNINNFTNDWNDGVALHALLDYCRPGLCPDWRRLDRSERLENCRNAMTLAKNNFDIPLVVRPEDLSSPDLDELSGMTYISYYMKIDSPGYHATMRMIRGLLKHGAITNFTTDWADGKLLCNLVKSLGGNIPGWPSLNGSNIDVLQMGIDGARTLGVEPVLTAKEMADPEVDHIGIMAYAAYFSSFKPARSAAEKVVFSRQPRDVYVNMEASFSLRIDDSDVSPGDIRAEIKGPDSNPPVHFNWSGRNAEGVFVPKETGIHRLNVFCENSPIVGCPVSFKAMADRSKIFFSGVEKCPLGLITELKVNAEQAGQGDVQCEARAPGGRVHNIAAVYRHGNYVMNFNPSEVGVWQISVLYDGDHINGSPFQVHVYDATNVKVYGLEGGVVGTGLNFNVDSSQAGDGDVRVEIVHEGNNVPAYIHSQRVGLYKIDFTPQGAGSYTVHVYFNDNEVRGSPYTLDIVDSSRVSVHGDGLHLVPCHRTADFIIDTHGSSRGRVNVEITGPSGRTVPAEVVGGTGEQRVEYVPVEIGDHRIEVKFNDSEVEGSPFLAKAYDASAITVTPISDTMVGHDVDFKIDVTRAGEGQLEIMVNNGNLPNNVEMERTGVYKISFVPIAAGTQTVDINFNKESIPESPLTCMAVDAAGVSIQGLATVVAANRLAAFTMVTESSGVSDARADVVIYSPSGVKMSSKIRESEKGKYAIEWVPVEVGSHLVEIYFYGKLVKGFPYVVKVFDPHRVKMLTKFETIGRYGEPMELCIDVSQAGEGQLEIMVECDGVTIPNTIKQEENGMFIVRFVPQSGGAHKVYMKFNEENVPGSPFIFEVKDDRVKVDQAMLTSTEVHRVKSANVQPPKFKMNTGYLRVHENQWFFLESSGVLLDPENLTIFVIDPHGSTVESHLFSQVDGSYKVEWTPRIAGRHRVEIMFAGREIDGSPFYIDVIDLGAIHLDNFRQGGVGEAAGFDVDFDVTNMLDYSVKIMAPSGRYVDHTANRGNDYGQPKKEIAYIPDESGPHEIYITYAGFELPGCPFIQNIDEGGLPMATGDGLYRGEEDKSAVFFVDVGNRKGDLNVQVDGPNSIAKCSIDPSDTRYGVTYIPVEVGIFTITIKWNGREIPGSPFHPKVVDPRKVRVQGGWQQFMDANERVHLIVGEEKRLPFDISQAGPGKLRAEVVGPSASIPVTIDDHTMGQSVVCFTPEEEGNHYIHLFWADLALPNSPFLGYAIHGVMDANKVVLMGRGLKEATVREEAEFIIDGSQAGPGTPEVTLTGVRAEISVQVFPLGNGKFRCVYIPVVPGAYLLHITWNGRQLRGSPYKVNIIGAFYPNKVVVSGEGLKGCLYGRHMDIGIDTRKAGPGELTASCMGPGTAAYCELEDHHDGTFYLRIKPQEIGRHVLQIKYGGEHVNGSPFAVKVGAQPDAGKVRVTGPGVEHGILANFQSRFIVETRGAGAGQLSVRIRGPKGAFQVEMFRESQKDRTILCRFDPVETGLYIIHVKWSGVDVPGSPFHVHIVDSQQELQQVLHEQSFGSSGVTPRSYAQWREEI